MNALKNMNRNVTSVVTSVVLIIGLSAFSIHHFIKNATPKATFYFQYSGTDAESAYETQSNWTALSSLPGTDPCPGANNIVCVLNTSDISSGTTSALVSYLSGLTPAATGATTYCHTAARENYKKP